MRHRLLFYLPMMFLLGATKAAEELARPVLVRPWFTAVLIEGTSMPICSYECSVLSMFPSTRCSMRFKSLLCLSLMLLFGAVQAAEGYVPPAPHKTWFTPTLVEGKGAFCEQALKEAKAYFLTRGRWADFSMRGFEAVYGTPAELNDGQGPLVFNTYTHPGCGGGCERYQVVASREALRDAGRWDELSRLAQQGPSPARHLSLFRRDKGGFYSIASQSDDDPGTLEINELQGDLRWGNACRIRVIPDGSALTGNVPAEVRRALSELSHASSGWSRGYGYGCGSLTPNWLRDEKRMLSTAEVYYRPWARGLSGTGDAPYAFNLVALQRWAATGVLEYRVTQDYQAKMDQAIKAVAGFYKQRFGWSPQQAQAMSSMALQSAISSGMGFSSSDRNRFFPDSELALRNAILAHRPMDEIRAIEGQVRDLSIAIEYPEALAYLIEQGADVNQANAFGKTALMYAAHYNQLESARILLARGAYPNAVTVLPEDDCYYTITTRNMTALHYAARYASPALARLLVDNGAEPFIQAHRKGEEGSTPLDWLHRYTAANAEEPNPNIGPDQVAEVEALLQPPTEEALQARAKRLVLEGEKAYGAGDLKLALRKLNLAINIQPHNERALSDLSLVALRDGDLGLSLQAGQALIDSSKDARLLANAWFNQGLACDASDSSWPFYNGTRYCEASAVYAYYQALAAHRTEARVAKLLQALQALPDAEVHRLLFEGREVRMVQRYGPDHSSLYLYLLHPRGLVIPAERIGWTLSSESKGTREITPSSVGREVLDDDWALTVLRRDERVDGGSLHIRPATPGSGAL